MSGPQPHQPRSPLPCPALLHRLGDGGLPAPGWGAVPLAGQACAQPGSISANPEPRCQPGWRATPLQTPRLPLTHEAHAGPSCPPHRGRSPHLPRGAGGVWHENAHDDSRRLQDPGGPGPRHGQTVAESQGHAEPPQDWVTRGGHLGREGLMRRANGAAPPTPPPTWWTRRRRAPVPRGTGARRWPRAGPAS